ncbi:MAG: response regulator [Nitrospirae bacterium]|nr:response regulator [Nitrospirota bacterium]
MHKTRILVVDDEEVLRNLYQEVLSSEGYEVLCAASGEEGLKKLQSDRFDLVVTDYRMPGMDGMEFLQRVKIFNVAIQVILLTSHIGPKTALDAMKAGAFWYLTKPVDINKLVDKVREALLVKEAE